MLGLSRASSRERTDWRRSPKFKRDLGDKAWIVNQHVIFTFLTWNAIHKRCECTSVVLSVSFRFALIRIYRWSWIASLVRSIDGPETDGLFKFWWKSSRSAKCARFVLFFCRIAHIVVKYLQEAASSVGRVEQRVEPVRHEKVQRQRGDKRPTPPPSDARSPLEYALQMNCSGTVCWLVSHVVIFCSWFARWAIVFSLTKRTMVRICCHNSSMWFSMDGIYWGNSAAVCISTVEVVWFTF